MKITRRQIRRIIEQAVMTGDQQVDEKVEAALVLRFVGTYLFAMRGVLRNADEAKYRGGHYGSWDDHSQYADITNFWKTAPIKHIRAMGMGLTTHDFDGELLIDGQDGLITKEDTKAMDDEALAVRDDDSSVTEKVDDLIAYLYDQTPMGMSAIEAAEVYGNDIKNHADAITKFFDDRADYFNQLDDSTVFDRAEGLRPYSRR